MNTKLFNCLSLSCNVSQIAMVTLTLLFASAAAWGECRNYLKEALALEQDYKQALEAGNFERLRTLKSEKEKLKNWVDDCVKQGKIKPSQETEEKLSSADLEAPTGNDKDRNEPGERDTWLTLKWTPRFRDFYHKVIEAISKSPEFRDIRRAALWQDFYEPSKRLHDYMSRQSELRDSKPLRVRARAWFDPRERGGKISDANFFVYRAQAQSDRMEATFPKPQPKPKKKATLPWTTEMLNEWKRRELREARTKDERDLARKKYFRGQQVINNWQNRYGKWDKPFSQPMDDWTNWFYENMYVGKIRGRQLWDNFLKERADRGGILEKEREVAINPFWPEREKAQYETYKDELASRDPTSLEFLEIYRPYIDPSNPEKLVDPPKWAQKHLIQGSRVKPKNNAELKAEIKRLRKDLGLVK